MALRLTLRDFVPRSNAALLIWAGIFAAGAVYSGAYAFGAGGEAVVAFARIMLILFASLFLVALLGRFVRTPAP